jgi:hypothetical protein
MPEAVAAAVRRLYRGFQPGRWATRLKGGVWIDGVQIKAGFSRPCSGLVEYRTSVNAPARYGLVVNMFLIPHHREADLVIARVRRFEVVVGRGLGEGPRDPLIVFDHLRAPERVMEYVHVRCFTHMCAAVPLSRPTVASHRYFVRVHVLGQGNRMWVNPNVDNYY